MIRCIKCGDKLGVTNTYNADHKIVRRLKCNTCGAVYKSVEVITEGFENGEKEESTESYNCR